MTTPSTPAEANAETGTELPLAWERPVSQAPRPDRLPEGRRAYRVHQFSVGAALFALVVIVVPVFEIVAVAGVWIATRSAHLTERLGPAIGIICAGAVVAYAANWLALAGNARFERRLRAILRERTGRQGGELVGVTTPEATTMQRHLEGHSDVGILYLDDDALVFEGLRQRLVVPFAEVQSATLAINWQFAQLGARWCVIAHRPGVATDAALEGAPPARMTELRFYSRAARTVRGSARATRAMHAQLQYALERVRGRAPGHLA